MSARRPLLLALLLTAVASSSAGQDRQNRDSARSYVGSLRARVAEAQRLYGKSLAPDAAPTPEALEHVESLRAELKLAILESAKNGTGSESVLAGGRAQIESLLDVIHAYEQAVGRPPEARTTAWNILTADELVGLEKEALQHQFAVQKAIDGLPAVERPPFLLARQREIASWIDELHRETARRVAGSPRGPPEIPEGISLRSVRARFPGITAVERQAGTLFEKHLAYQVELRLSNSPGDASLNALRDLLPRMQEPVYRVAPKRPPPTVKDTIDDLEQAVREEKDATILRDPVRRAVVRARIDADLKWLEINGTARDLRSPWGADLVSTETLKSLRKEYADWQFRLTEESGGIRSEASVFEMEHVRQRLSEIDAALDGRTFHWGQDGGPIAEDPTVSPRTPNPRGPRPSGPPATQSYEIGMERDRLSSELKYLQQEADTPGALENVSLRRAITQTGADLKAETDRLIGRARAALDRAEINLLENGRGTRGAAEGAKLLRARQAIAAGENPADLAYTLESSPFLKARSTSPSTLTVLTENPSLPKSGAARAQLLELPIRRGSLAGGAAANQAVAEFEDLFPRTDRAQDFWTRSYKGVMEDLRRAPGGIVIDAKLPAAVGTRIEKAQFDPETGDLRLLIGGSLKEVQPRVDAETVRIAYAFVKDGRVMPMDLRNINSAESLLLAHEIVPQRDLGPSDWQKIDDALSHFTAVNAHPAIQDTEIAMQMIRADQFIFDLLPDGFDTIPLYGSSVRFGLDIAPLRRIYQQELFSLSNPEAWRALFQKSILSVVGVRADVGSDRVRIDPQLRFAIYRLPASKVAGKGFPLEKSAAWLQEREAQFKSLAVLDPLIRFATAVAVVRTVLDENVPNNLDEVLGVTVKVTPTPRLLCRSEDRDVCGLASLRMAVK
jgi:hypothetical protein